MSDTVDFVSCVPDPVCSPSLLDFTQTEQTWAALSEDERRDAVVAMLEQVVNFGVADAPPGRREAYGDIIAPGESPIMRGNLLKKISGNSSCGLLIRSVWRFLGARDPLLDPPYVLGTVIIHLLNYAQKAGARRTLTAAHFDPENIAVKKGDVIFMAAGTRQHIFTVLDITVDSDGAVIVTSIDGGQSSDCVDDGVCNGIQRRARKLDPATLHFEDDERRLTYWIDVTALPFTAPMINLTKGMSDEDVKP